MNDASTPNLTSNSSPSSQERNWAVFCHLAALSGAVSEGVGCLLGPLIIWMLKKDQMPFVADQGREALNFQITVLIGLVLAFLLRVLVIGYALLALIVLFDLVCVIIGAIKASEGVAFRYPINLRLIK